MIGLKIAATGFLLCVFSLVGAWVSGPTKPPVFIQAALLLFLFVSMVMMGAGLLFAIWM